MFVVGEFPFDAVQVQEYVKGTAPPLVRVLIPFVFFLRVSSRQVLQSRRSYCLCHAVSLHSLSILRGGKEPRYLRCLHHRKGFIGKGFS